MATWIIVSTAYTQSDTLSKVYQERFVSILAGYDFWRTHYAEVGVALNQFGRVGHHPAAWAMSASCEVQISTTPWIAPKLGGYIGGGVAGIGFGGYILTYFGPDDPAIRFRPEIGIAVGPIKLAYGYNLPLTNADAVGVKRSVVSLQLLIGLKKLKIIEHN